MGTLNNNPVRSTEAIFAPHFHHFSHPHVLLLRYQPQNANKSCSACKGTLSGSAYYCLQCDYFLHLSCSQNPSNIEHPFDHNGHNLNHLPVPPYPEGKLICDACGKQLTDFCYNCAQCSVALHVACASMPLSVTHGSHFHPLDLTYSPPYQNNHFICDICRVPTLPNDHWLYRCQSCEFDAHLDCALGRITPRLPAPIQGCDFCRNQMNNSVNGLATTLMLGLRGVGGLGLGSGGSFGGDGSDYYDGDYGDQMESIQDSSDGMGSIG